MDSNKQRKKSAAIIVSAGKGNRMNSKIMKQYLLLDDKPIIAHTLKVFDTCPLIDDIVLVVPPGDIEYCRDNIVNKYGLKKVGNIVEGGPERQHSVYNGLGCIGKEMEIVVIHDGVRPLVTHEIISDSIEQADLYGCTVAAVDVKDTIKVADERGFVVNTLERSTLRAMQTPQTFRKEVILKAYEYAMENGIYGTDDATLAEYAGFKVKLVKGNYENIKITTPEDMIMATAVINARRTNNRKTRRFWL
ncbi:MAG: 2-C-methyl-D-erythritol 4-phosphate cytidylyltransferase [Mahellales bacterium]|jgi:2-C-methyl-D-erythritol 4-phosphate cytidylyltransferase